MSACERLDLRPVDEKWYRAIRPEYSDAALGSSHTLSLRSRFSQGNAADLPFEILYLAESLTVALYEVRAQYGPPDRPIPDPDQSKWDLLDIDVKLQSVADLTDVRQRKRLGISAQELTGDWKLVHPNNDAPTQRLGAALYATEGIEGFLAISATMPRCKTLVIFPRKLRAGSELSYKDPRSRKIHRIPNPGR
ncbi:RES family NAD+ phosphorylase [Tundrisphaera lichenicola]|uniref:RES family NAD+ phosphorylase n=1 Tax=Tundrisphaera lichenicola TaxID=2029860 RepID=UPI003EB8C31F